MSHAHFDQQLRDSARPMVETSITEETLLEASAAGAISRSRTSLSIVELIAAVAVVVGLVGVVRFLGVSTTGGRAPDGIAIGGSFVSVTSSSGLLTVSATTKGGPATVLVQAKVDPPFGVRQLVCDPASTLGQHVVLFGTAPSPISVTELGAGTTIQLDDGSFIFVGEASLVPGQPWSVETRGEPAISGHAATLGERLSAEPTQSGTTPCVAYNPATEKLK